MENTTTWIKKTPHVSPERQVIACDIAWRAYRELSCSVLLIAAPLSREQDRRTVLFNRLPTAPSVPARHQSYGYEEVRFATCERQTCPVHPAPSFPRRSFTGTGADYAAGPLLMHRRRRGSWSRRSRRTLCRKTCPGRAIIIPSP